jgi:hypothetical protein
MNDDAKEMTCAEFQEHLPELIGTGEDISSHPHLQSCDLCRELLSDLETIADAARQLFPVADPPDELWDHIVAAIHSDAELPQKELSENKQVGPPSADIAGELA